MPKLNKNQRRKKKVQAKRQASQLQARQAQLAWDQKFNAERKTARQKIRAGYRAADIIDAEGNPLSDEEKEKWIQKICPESQD
jgi:hypothetical protein